MNLLLVIVTDNLNLFWNVNQLTDGDLILCRVIFGLSLVCQIAFIILSYLIYVKGKKEYIAFIMFLLLTLLEMAYCVISYVFRIGFLFFPAG